MGGSGLIFLHGLNELVGFCAVTSKSDQVIHHNRSREVGEGLG
jgi:hypothetical protein